MNPDFVRACRKQVVDLEYNPPGRAMPEFFSSTVQRPILWDVLGGEFDIAVLLLPNPLQVNYAPPVAAPGMPAVKTPGAQLQSKTFYNFTLRLLETKYITSIALGAGFLIDVDARRAIADQPVQFVPTGETAFYGNPAEAKFVRIWNAEIWARVERRLVELKLKREAESVPEAWVRETLKPAATPAPAPEAPKEMETAAPLNPLLG